MFKHVKKYRTQSMRMPGWDYSRNGKYFITITVEGWHHWFGEVVDGAMVLSDFGRIVVKEWLKSFEMRDELFLDEFVLMPNHLHGLVVLMNRAGNGADGDGEMNELADGKINELADGKLADEKTNGGSSVLAKPLSESSSLESPFPSESRSSSPSESGSPSESSPSESESSSGLGIQMARQSISSFIAGFKSSSNNRIDDFIDEQQLDIPKFNRKNRLWHVDFYDTIIRDDEHYWRTKNYIINNPKKWDSDKFNRKKRW